MATISTTFKAIDQISPAFKSMTANMSGVLNSADKIKNAIGGIDSNSLKDVSSSAKSADNSLDSLTSGANSVSRSVKGIASNSINTLSNSARSADNSLGALKNEAKQTGQSIQSIDGDSLDDFSNSATRAAHTLDQVGKSAQKLGGVGQSLGGLGSSFSSISKVKEVTEQAAESQNDYNQSMNEGGSITGILSGKFKGLMGAITGVVGTYAGLQGIKAALNWSDEISQTTSRLNLVNDSYNEINNSQQTTAELQNKIFDAAQRSRGSYQDMQNLVASIGNNAKDAFKDTSEIVTFAESLNKVFAIGGASAEEMSNATLQLTQGLASGVLRGDELNSVLENAPELINVIAESMGVPRGQIRELAAEGQITADVVKNALIGSSEEINAKFQGMDVTFSQLWTQFTNYSQKAFEPVSKALGELANNPEFQTALKDIGDTIGKLAPDIADIVESLVGAAPTAITGLVGTLKWLVDNRGPIGYVFSTVAGALAAYKTYSMVSGIFDTIKTAINGAAGAQAFFNVVVNMNPIMLLVTAIGALIGAVVYLWNTNEDFRNAVIGAWNSIKTAFSDAWTAICGVFDSLGQAWEDAKTQVSQFGTNLWATITSWGTTIDEKARELVGNFKNGLIAKWEEVKTWFNEKKEAFITTISTWYDSAVEWGTNTIENFKSGLTQKWEDIKTWFNEKKDAFVNTVSDWYNSAFEWGSNLIQGFKDGLKEKWEGVKSWISDHFGGIIPQVQGIFEEHSPSKVFSRIGGYLVEGFQQGIKSDWQNFEDWVSTIFTNVVHVVQQIFGGSAPSSVFSDIGANTVAQLRTGIETEWVNTRGRLDSIQEEFLGTFNIGKTPLTGSVDMSKTLTSTESQIEEIALATQQGYDKILEIVNTENANLSGNTVETFSQLKDSAIRQVADMADSALALLGKIPQQFNTSFAVANSASTKETGKTVDAFSWMKNNVVSQVTDIADSTIGIVEQIPQQFISAFTTANAESTKETGKTVGIFSKMRNNVVSQIEDMADSTMAVTEKIPQQFSTTFTAQSELIPAKFQSLAAGGSDAIANESNDALKFLNDVLSEQLGLMNSSADNSFGALSNVVVSDMNGLNRSLDPTVQNMSGSITDTLQVMNDTILSDQVAMRDVYIANWGALSTISITLVGNFLQTTLGLFTAFSASLISMMATMAAQVIKIIQTMTSTILGIIGIFVRSIISTMSVLPKEFYSIATQMMEQFQLGIENKKQSIIDTTSDLVKKLKDTFIKGLGIHSPSRFMTYIGEMMAAGLMGGLTQAQLGQFAKNTLGEIIDAFAEGKFNADDLVEFLGHDTLKVIQAIQSDPELLKKAMMPGMMPAGSASSIVAAALKYVGYKSYSTEDSEFGRRLGLSGAWCAYFVKCCADEAGVFFPEIYHVPTIVSWAKSHGLYSMQGEVGDAAIMKNGGHIGIAAGFTSDGGVRIIDGNTWEAGGDVGVYDHIRHDVCGFVKLGKNANGAAATTSEGIAYPLIGTRGTQTSWFGHRASPGGIGSTNHQGVDLAAPTGTPIASALAGTVKQAGWYGGYGNAVTVSTGDLDIVYGHMSQVLASQGAQVGKGQQIGLVGSTGNSTGPHLHFEIRKNGSAIDPQPYIDGSAVTIGAGAGVGGMNLIQTIQAAYYRKYGMPTPDANLTPAMLATDGSGLLNPGWFQAWTPPPNVARWTPHVLQVLSMLGEPASLLKGVLWAINGESSGDPNATYTGDQNIIYGGSKGLLQTITPNFERWKNPALPNNIYDPMQNIWVCLREMQETYGGIAQLINRKIARGKWSGYAVGTRNVPYDMLAMIHQGEAILPKSQNPYSESGGNYLREIGDQIGAEVVKSSFNPDLIPVYFPDLVDNTTQNISPEETIDYSGLRENLVQDRVVTVSSNSIGSAPITIEVNIQNVNNQGDLDNIENQVVRSLTNAINRAAKATGAVASV